MPVDIDMLNEPQREAVLVTEGPLLVLAGAGSGKTRVLTYRIANLLENHGVAPWEVLAITFTNKAANEMSERLGGLVGPRARGMWVSTFHSMCVRILRSDAERLGFTKNFTIYDTDDLKRLYKEIMAELDVDPKRYPVNALMNRISQAKNELVVPGDFAEQATDPVGKVAARVYERLQERLRAANAFDFDDLLLYAYLLLKHHEDVLAAYRERFRYIMVDEYQDTNHAQYEITMLLAAAHRNIMVVGDDDQSIYSWRGADLRNILEFENDFPEAHVVKLEQNYRSTGNILAAANAVIANNRQRKDKRLYTDAGDGEKVDVYMATDERDEGRWIAGEIEREHAHDVSYSNIAVFYRTNAQSRMLEDMLLRAGVPYRIVGGTRFFDRAEIRDVMAYLTLVVNPADDIAAKRVINVPRRGIGRTTVDRIEHVAHQMDLPFLEAAETLIAESDVRASARKAIGGFLDIIKEARTYGGDLRKVVEAIIDRSGLVSALEAEHTDEADGRIENIWEFLGVVDEFTQTHDEDEADYAAPTARAPEDADVAGGAVVVDDADGANIDDSGAGDAGDDDPDAGDASDDDPDVDDAGEASVAGNVRNEADAGGAGDVGDVGGADGADDASGAAGADDAGGAADAADAAGAGDVGDVGGAGGAADAGDAGGVDGAGANEEPVRVLHGDSLADFVEWVRLRTDVDTMTEGGRAVTLMTVHSAKGLEFDCVFVAGMEESIFPHMNSIGEPSGLEEERRLAYVAITRARKRLYLLCAQQRQLFGQTSSNPVSRFISEIPEELRHVSGVGSAGFAGTGWEKRGSRRGIAGSGAEAGEGRVFGSSSARGSRKRDRKGGGHGAGRASGTTRDAGVKSAARMTFAVGDEVDHKTFGRGEVLKVDGDTLKVKFAKSGQTKKLLKDYAPIVKINERE